MYALHEETVEAYERRLKALPLDRLRLELRRWLGECARLAGTPGRWKAVCRRQCAWSELVKRQRKGRLPEGVTADSVWQEERQALEE